MTQAKHKHDLALAAVSNAEKDLETRKAEAERLQNELAKRKGDVNETVQGQKTHNVSHPVSLILPFSDSNNACLIVTP